MTTFIDLVAGTSTTTGTGGYTISGSVDGFRPFSVVPDGTEVTVYVSLGADYELLTGVVSGTGTSITRATVHNSSNSDAAVNWGAGTKTLRVVASSDMLVNPTSSADDSSGPVNAFEYDTFNAISNTGSNIVSYKVEGVEMFSFDYTGRLNGPNIYSQFVFGVWFTRFIDSVIFDTGASWGSSAGLQAGEDVSGNGWLRGNADASTGVVIGNQTSGYSLGSHPTGPVIVKGESAGNAPNTAHRDGGDLTLEAGDAYSVAGSGTGGDVLISAGAGGPTGDDGNIIIPSLPTSSAGLPAGAIWNDSGTLKIA